MADCYLPRIESIHDFVYSELKKLTFLIFAKFAFNKFECYQIKEGKLILLYNCPFLFHVKIITVLNVMSSISQIFGYIII